MAIILGRKPGGGGGGAPSGPAGGDLAGTYPNPTIDPTAAVVSVDGGGGQLAGDVTFSAGSNVTLTQVGQDIEIAAGGGGSLPGGYPILPVISAWSAGNALMDANRADFSTFWVPIEMTISGVILTINSSLGNIDVGIYNTSAHLPNTRLASSGSVAMPASGNKIVSLSAPVTLSPGQYWAAMAGSDGGRRLFFHTLLVQSGAASTTAFPQRADQATAFPLPATAGATLVSATDALFGIFPVGVS